MAAYVSKRCKSGIRPAAERIQPKARIELKPGDPEYERIKVSIECFGYAKSIIVNRDLTVADGHQRLNDDDKKLIGKAMKIWENKIGK